MTNEPVLNHDLRYFQQMYAGAKDPWGFDSSRYEDRKFALTIASLPRPQFRRAVEPGCANGALTQRLASRCGELIAFDVIPDAVARARDRLADQPHVSVRQESFPQYWPAGSGDLVVWSEVAYYLTDEGKRAAREGLEAWLEPGGVLVAVHYTDPTDYPQSGAAIGAWLDGLDFLRCTTRVVDQQFELGVWQRVTTSRGTGSVPRRSRPGTAGSAAPFQSHLTPTGPSLTL
ncbi:MAG: SAM-dependent methyltransferase [Euzebya sp.]